MKNYIDSRGFVSVDDGRTTCTVVVPSMANDVSGTLTCDRNGRVSPMEVSCIPKHAYHTHSSGIQTLTAVSGSYQQLYVDGACKCGSLLLWDCAASVFRPSHCGVYTVQFRAKLDSVVDTPTLQLDLVPSGCVPGEMSDFRHLYCHEQVLRNTDPVIHVNTSFTVVVDSELIASGAVLMATCTHTPINIHSASVLISET